MNDAAPARPSPVGTLNLLCLAACGVTAFATGPLAMIAGAIALASFAGSIVATLAENREPPSDWDSPEDAYPPLSQAAPPAIAQQPETSPAVKSWVLSLDHSRQASRHR